MGVDNVKRNAYTLKMCDYRADNIKALLIFGNAHAGILRQNIREKVIYIEGMWDN
jgi:hypothetical protein